MPLQKLQFKPGVNRDQTNYSNEGGWYECDKIRFRSGYPQKVGGWQRYGIFTIDGACYQTFNWITSYSDNLLAIGTNRKTYIEAGANLFDISPLRTTFTTPSTNNCVSVTSGSNVVTITINNHGVETGAYVTLSGIVGSGSPQNIGGIPITELNAEHKATETGVNTFTITVTTSATSTVSNAGGTAVVAACQLNPGYAYTTFGYGWGTGTWGRGGWGSGSTSPVNFQQRDWWFDQFDNDLVMNIRNGPIYIWERGILANPSTALNTRAVLLSSLAGADEVPNEAMQILVAQNNKHLLAFGCTPLGGGQADPLLIRWANQDDPVNWFPEPTNSAGFIRVSRGSSIVRAIATRQEILVFTDATLSTLQFTGTTDVFSLQELADNISIISPRAPITVNNTTYWMGTDKFYAYSGRVETLPCSLRNHVFQNINLSQADQIVCGTNEGWNEIWWFYPTADSQVNNAYVIYNYLEHIWYYGSLERSAWSDSPLRQYPQAIKNSYTDSINATGIMYNHELGTNADTLPMVAYIKSSDFDLIDGDQFILSKRIIPDVDFAGSTAENPEVNMILRAHNFPGSAYNSESTRVIQSSIGQYTDQVFIRMRARQMGFEIRSTELNTQWQLGTPRLDGRPDGKR